MPSNACQCAPLKTTVLFARQSQTAEVWSSDAVTTLLPSRLNDAWLTSSVWCFSSAICLPVSIFQMRAVLSADAVRACRPSGSNDAVHTLSVCPRSGEKLCSSSSVPTGAATWKADRLAPPAATTMISPPWHLASARVHSSPSSTPRRRRPAFVRASASLFHVARILWSSPKIEDRAPIAKAVAKMTGTRSRADQCVLNVSMATGAPRSKGSKTARWNGKSLVDLDRVRSQNR